MIELSGLSRTYLVQTVVSDLHQIAFLVAAEERGFGFGEIQYKKIRVLTFRRRLSRHLRQHRLLRHLAALAPEAVGGSPAVRKARLVRRIRFPKGIKVRVHNLKKFDVLSLSLALPILVHVQKLRFSSKYSDRARSSHKLKFA